MWTTQGKDASVLERPADFSLSAFKQSWYCTSWIVMNFSNGQSYTLLRVAGTHPYVWWFVFGSSAQWEGVILDLFLNHLNKQQTVEIISLAWIQSSFCSQKESWLNVLSLGISVHHKFIKLHFMLCLFSYQNYRSKQTNKIKSYYKKITKL